MYAFDICEHITTFWSQIFSVSDYTNTLFPLRPSELQNNHWIYGSPDDYDYQDKLILNYAGPTDGVRCTNVPCATDGPLAALRLEVEPRPIDWVSFYSQLAEPFEFRIARRADGSADIEENVWQCVQTLAGRLRNSRIFMEADAALNAPGVSVSNYLKLHKNDTQTIRTRLYFEVVSGLRFEVVVLCSSAYRLLVKNTIYRYCRSLLIS